MEKEIWTIDDIIKDYENQGLAGRSKVDFLNDVKDFILKNTRYVQWSTISAEEHEKVIKEVKQRIEEKMKDEDCFIIDYMNPRLSLKPGHIYIPKPETKKYLKWEDLKFEENKLKKIKVKMGEHIYTLEYQSYKDEKDNIIDVADLWLDQRCISRDLGKYVFEDLRLEVVE